MHGVMRSGDCATVDTRQSARRSSRGGRWAPRRRAGPRKLRRKPRWGLGIWERIHWLEKERACVQWWAFKGPLTRHKSLHPARARLTAGAREEGFRSLGRARRKLGRPPHPAPRVAPPVDLVAQPNTRRHRRRRRLLLRHRPPSPPTDYRFPPPPPGKQSIRRPLPGPNSCSRRCSSRSRAPPRIWIRHWLCGFSRRVCL
ncbi:hypothetical protein BDA96_09G110700 [Sorghum bicolor]|uniref:Uncharacterized protein n=1 Tax=Sorghum bicolor TaxID=4558 RepID=A0A921QBI2_SORBI|nr:hypothetical protein BDA96_09G110700 [Sorghum bicolor]